MRTIIVNGKEIRTNYKENYYLGDGNPTKTKDVAIKHWNENEEQMFKRLVDLGYTNITFKYSTTQIRGYYDIYALVK